MPFKSFTQPHLTTLQKIQVFEPTYKNVLFIISEDAQAFAAQGMIDIIKSIQPNAINPKMAAMLGLYMELLQRGYVRQDGLTTRITPRGRWYLLATHFSLGFWAIVAAFIIGAASTSIPLCLSRLTRPEAPQIRSKESSSPSLPVYHSKILKDSAKRK